ncbi:uncharacterized protein [Haliotis cracherodii]|uniref:uncharacterized protein n=1 Tax=Haliotis cracherodii TaxID=6455 RepID=UPI0039EAC509
MAVLVALILVLTCGAVHTFQKDCYDRAGKCQKNFERAISHQTESKCLYYQSLLRCFSNSTSMSRQCKVTALTKTKRSCNKLQCDKGRCTKGDWFLESNTPNMIGKREACSEDKECLRRANTAHGVASNNQNCSIYQEDYRCYDEIPKTCNFAKKVASQKQECIRNCELVKVPVNENCERKDVPRSNSPVPILSASMTTISPAVNGRGIAGGETKTAFQNVTRTDVTGHDNVAHFARNITDTGNDVNTTSPLSRESKSGAGLMWAPIGVAEVLLVWTLGYLL